MRFAQLVSCSVILACLATTATAQVADASSASARRAFDRHRLLMAARAAGASDPALALARWDSVTRLEPTRTEAWVQVMRLAAGQGDVRGALQAAEMVARLGDERLAVMYHGFSTALARGGQRALAFEWLGRSLAAGFERRAELADDPAWVAYRNDTTFQRLAGVRPPAPDRLTAWREDLEFFLEEARRLHADARSPARSETIATEV